MSLFIATNGIAQTHIIKDTLFLNTGQKIMVGQDLQIGIGSNTNTKDFNFIYIAPNIITTEQIKLTSTWIGKKMKIKGFKKQGSKKFGDKYFVVLGGGNIANYWCDIEPAIQFKEVTIE